MAEVPPSNDLVAVIASRRAATAKPSACVSIESQTA